MANRSDHSTPRPPRGPWPEVNDLDRLFDHGRWWCINAAGHPADQDDYPDAEVHRPWHECRSVEVDLDGACRDLIGDAVFASVYLAEPFRFGMPRTDASVTRPRLVVEFADADEESRRFSVGLGEAARLARILAHLVDHLAFPSPRT
jgi:hypothetical protein